MHQYTFDVPLIAAITIAADTADAAAATLQAALENCRARLGDLAGECSLMENIDLHKHLGMVDGVDCINQYGRMPRTAD